MAGTTQHTGEPTWSSRAAFTLAAIGSAVGLGNLWRFPYQAGENGGGAFVLVYFICVLLIGLPVLAAELFLGRRGGGSAVGAIKRLAQAEGKTTAWTLFAWIGMITSFLIVTFYSVIAGWVLYFAVEMVKDLFANISANGMAGLTGGAFAGQSAEDVSGKLGELLASPGQMILYHAIFMVMTVFIIARGVKGGIEKAVKILMPSFFVMLILLTIFAMVIGAQANADGVVGTTRAASYLFMPKFSQLGPLLADGSILQAALGQAFFSIGLGSALMITYGMYMNRDTDIPSASRTVAIADTGVALIAGMAIFPIVFRFGLEPAGGPGLMFSTLPLAFQQMPFGSLFGIAFFLMALFAALTSAISLLEVAASVADGDIGDKNQAKKRVWGSIIIGVLCFAIGVANALSQVPAASGDYFWNTFIPVSWMPLFEGKTLLDFLDQLTGQVLLPLGGFLTAVFAGWIVSQAASREELGFKSEAWFKRWLFLIRLVCPIAVGIVLVYSMFIAPTIR